MPGSGVFSTVRANVRPTAVWFYGAVVVGLLGADAGGYRPVSSGWAGFLCFGTAAVVLLIDERLEWGVLELISVGAFAAFVGWVALSALWSPSVTSTMHDVERDLAYLGVLVCGLLLVRGSMSAQLLGGVLAGIGCICAYAVGSRLRPDIIGYFNSESFNYRLSAPITYWNSLGLLAVTGILLALQFAARARRLSVRGLSAATVPVLTLTMFFTFSRGAWFALGIGLLVSLAVDPERLHFIFMALPAVLASAIGVEQAHAHAALTTTGATLTEATQQGRGLLVVLVLLVCASGLATGGLAYLERRVAVRRQVRWAFAWTIVALAGSSLLAAFAHFGSPMRLVSRSWEAFRGAPTRGSTGDVTHRLFQLSSDGRLELWRVSWTSFRLQPWRGNGAGTFWELWPRYRHSGGYTHEGHSLYITTLGELGWIGLLLLTAAVIVPLLALTRRRSAGVVTAGAYTAFLVHAGYDWDWQLMGVGAAGVLMWAAVLSTRRSNVTSALWLRVVASAFCISLATFSLWTLLGERALDAGARDAASGRTQTAAGEFDRAAFLLPWSSQPDESRAASYAQSGNQRLASVYYLKALRKDSQSWILWSELAMSSHGAERRIAERRLRELMPNR